MGPLPSQTAAASIQSSQHPTAWEQTADNVVDDHVQPEELADDGTGLSSSTMLGDSSVLDIELDLAQYGHPPLDSKQQQKVAQIASSAAEHVGDSRQHVADEEEDDEQWMQPPRQEYTVGVANTVCSTVGGPVKNGGIAW